MAGEETRIFHRLSIVSRSCAPAVGCLRGFEIRCLYLLLWVVLGLDRTCSALLTKSPLLLLHKSMVVEFLRSS